MTSTLYCNLHAFSERARSPALPGDKLEERGGRSSVHNVCGMSGEMSADTTDVLSADTTDGVLAGTTDVLSADTTDVLSADTSTSPTQNLSDLVSQKLKLATIWTDRQISQPFL